MFPLQILVYLSFIERKHSTLLDVKLAVSFYQFCSDFTAH